MHGDRDRARSFGAVAAAYDRYRPGYPDELIADLLAGEPVDAVDVGCGTGQVARALAAHRVPVLGVKVDDRMAAVARGHGLVVEVAPFETWADRGRRFDLLTSGDAWHWINPIAGIAKAADVLRPGGLAAWFWSSARVDEATAAAFDVVYREYAPEVTRVWRTDRDPRPDRDPLAGSTAFTAPEVREYRWRRTLTAAEWTGRQATVSDHLRFGEPRLTALLRALHDTVETLGGRVHSHGRTTALFAHRRGPRRT